MDKIKSVITDLDLRSILKDEKKFNIVKNSMETFLAANPGMNEEIAILDNLTHGKGVNMYREICRHRMMSNEFLGFVALVNRGKTIDLTTEDGLKLHVYRNKNQKYLAPKDLDTMNKMVDGGWFVYEGFSPCHNIINDVEMVRRVAVTATAKLYASGGIKRNNTYSTLGNLSFRGNPDTLFRGCQFVYNSKTGQIVLDNVNRGTYDYGRYGTNQHVYLDVLPWVKVGNGQNDETKDLENTFLTFLKTAMYLKDGFIIEPEELKLFSIKSFTEGITESKFSNNEIVKFFKGIGNKMFK